MNKVIICCALRFSLFLLLVSEFTVIGSNIIAAQSDSKILFVNISTNFPKINFQVNNNQVATNIQNQDRNSSNFSYTNYITVNSGNNTIRVVDSNNSKIVIDTVLNLKDSSYYSLFVIDSANKAKCILIQDSLPVIPSGMSFVRFINMNADSTYATLSINAAREFDIGEFVWKKEIPYVVFDTLLRFDTYNITERIFNIPIPLPIFTQNHVRLIANKYLTFCFKKINYVCYGCSMLQIIQEKFSSNNISEYDTNSQFVVYPNPTNSYVIIDCGDQTEVGACSFVITNSLGEEKMSSQFTTRFQQIDISGLVAGLYIISIRDGSNTMIETRKLLIQ